MKHGAFCLETQKYADAVHHVRLFFPSRETFLPTYELIFFFLLINSFQENFPSIILTPGEVYEHETIYKFGISDEN
jgi:galactose mutarotase-like enzyme